MAPVARQRPAPSVCPVRDRLTRNRRRWERVRRRVLDQDGWRCRACGRAGRLEVDHVVPVADGGEVWNPANLQTLCRQCHIRKTIGENRERRRRDDPPAVTRWRDLLDSM